jgi:Tol biopolymer transport system component
VFLRDRVNRTITRVSVTTAGAQAQSGSGNPAISADGRVVAFDSPANDLVAHDLNGSTDVFVRDLDGLTTQLVSATNLNDEGDGSSRTPALSADGRYVAFQSTAPLVPADDNGVSDIYVRDRKAPQTKILSTKFDLSVAHGPSFGAPALSADGRYVSFQSSATDLVDNDTDHVDDVFTRAAITPRISKVVPSLDKTAPATIAPGTDVYFLVRGTYFLPDVQAYALAPGLTSDPPLRLSETELTIHVTAAADAPAGTAAIVVAEPGTGGGQNFGSAGVCFCVQVTG